MRIARLEVGVGNVDAWARAPVAKKAWFDIREFEWAIEQEIILQKNLSNREIITKIYAVVNVVNTDAQPMLHMLILS